jgi:hypothetical protein
MASAESVPADRQKSELIMSTGEQPMYVSRRSFRSLGQQYRIYTDRVELGFLGFRKIITGTDILAVEVRPACVIGDLFRGKGLAAAFALKLDLADLFRHVAIHRRSGWLRYVRFAPDDPDTFVQVCKSIMRE